MLSKKIESALNEQIVKEAFSSQLYLAMASWCDVQGLQGCAEFLYEQSKEELVHMNKILRYINASGGHALVAALKEPAKIYKSISQIIEQGLEHEKFITKSILQIVDLSLDEKDYTTFNFLQWFVSEQHEEETMFTAFLSMIKLTQAEDKSPYFIDKAAMKFRAKEKC